MKLRSVVLFTYTSLVFMASVAFANVVLIGNNVTVSFNDIQANFAPRVKGSGECGVLYLAEPLNACSSLKARSGLGDDVGYPPFVLIIRGGCSFEDKVKRAQSAGYRAAVVYDNEENGALIAMAGNSSGIKIHAVFISKEAGQVLKSYTGLPNMELWLIPGFENSAWSIMAVSFISLLAMSAILATCFFVRRHRIRRERPRGSRAPGFHRMSSGLVRALPSHIFMAASEGDCTSLTCAICLEDYIVGEKLRILPCRHKFHALCVDCWLTAWRSFCPVCKRDARASMSDPPASESTPLLSPNPPSTPSMRLSPPIQIVRGQAHSCPIPRIPFSGQLCLHQHHLGSFASPYHSLGNSPVSLSPGTGHDSAGVRHLSPLCPSAGNSRCMSVYVPNPNGWSRSPAGRPWPLHYSGSAASFLAFTSAGSPPEC